MGYWGDNCMLFDMVSMEPGLAVFTSNSSHYSKTSTAVSCRHTNTMYFISAHKNYFFPLLLYL